VRPATPLPFRVETGDGHSGLDLVGYGMDRESGECIAISQSVDGREALERLDFEYIAHAANAYPKLVAALLHLEQAYSNKHSPQHRAHALGEAASILRELGETS
jgi:hypothetical protein